MAVEARLRAECMQQPHDAQNKGMAATSEKLATPAHAHAWLSAQETIDRLYEEVERSRRTGAALSCLLVSLEDEDELAREHGPQLPAHALAYMGDALTRQLRRYDRVGRIGEGELLVLLPGADERRAEIVARRSLGRLNAVKLELDGRRRTIGVAVGIAAWESGTSPEQLLQRTRLAAGRPSGRGDEDDAELADGGDAARGLDDEPSPAHS